MRVFVFGTGRCGSKTFSKACEHIINFTSGHETHAGRLDKKKYLTYPSNHIEVDPHLTWMLEQLLNLYTGDRDKDIVLVHLIRDKNDVVNSWVKRSSNKIGSMHLLGKSFYQGKIDSNEKLKSVGNFLYDSIVERCNYFIRTAKEHYKKTLNIQSMMFHLHRNKTMFKKFWNMISAKGSLASSMAEFTRTYNKY